MGRSSREKLSKRSQRYIRRKYVLFVEGEKTERLYFKSLEKLLQKGVRVKVVIDTYNPKTDLRGLVDKVMQFDGSYRSIWVICDRDKNDVKDYLDMKKIFEQYVSSKSDERVMGGLIMSVPSFEYWLLLHLKNTAASLSPDQLKSELTKLIQKMKNKLSKYDKTNQFCIEAFLTEGDIDEAVKRSKQYGEIIDEYSNDYKIPSTDMYRLVELMLMHRKEKQI